MNNNAEDYVYDRGRNVSMYSSTVAVEEVVSNQRVQYDNPSFIRYISEEDLRFESENVLGSTKTAKVSLGYYVQRGHGILANFENEMEVAIKEVKKGTITERKMIKGLEPWAKIRNLNVIEIIGLCPRLDNKLPLIIMECGKGGTLKEFIRKINFSIPEKIIAKWAYQIAAGMAGIHDCDVVHRDLCSNNIVMLNAGESIEEMEKNILKIIDVNDQDSQGTPLNMSPDDPITKKSDIFSFGSVIWELLTRHKEELYDGKKLCNMDPDKLTIEIGFRLVVNRETFIIPECNQKLTELIKECWNFDPEQRPNFNAMIEKLNELESSLPDCDELEYDIDESENEDENDEYDVEEDDEEEEDFDEGSLSGQLVTDELYQDGTVSSEHAFNLQSTEEIERPKFDPQDISIPNLLF